jgi:hypothetical protein
MRAADWHSLSVSWTERGISPNYGKAMTSASFEWEGWLGVISHYDLEDAAQLDVVLSELIGLIRDGTVPPDAFTYAAP